MFPVCYTVVVLCVNFQKGRGKTSVKKNPNAAPRSDNGIDKQREIANIGLVSSVGIERQYVNLEGCEFEFHS